MSSHRKPIRRDPAYQQIASDLRVEILANGQPGERLPSEPALAAKYGVSILTLRGAIKLLVDDGMVRREQGRGTFICNIAKTGYIALVSESDLTGSRVSPSRLRVIQRLKQRLHREGYRVRIHLGDANMFRGEGDANLIELEEDINRQMNVSGIALIPSLHCDSILYSARKQNIPIVGYYGSQLDASVMPDYLGALQSGLDYLYKRGRQRIGVIGWGYSSDLSKFQAFCRDWFVSRRLTYTPAWIRADWSPSLQGAGWGQFRELWSSHREKPDGLVVCDDYLVNDVVNAAVNLQLKVPNDLEIVGQTNTLYESCFPWPIARLMYDPDAHADVLAEKLLILLNKKELENAHCKFPFQLIEPESQSEMPMSLPSSEAMKI